MTMPARIPVAREGWPFVIVPAVVALGLTLAGRRRLALPFWAASAASLGFFRDPERALPPGARAVRAPADRRGREVADAVDPFVGPAVRVAIFLSPLDVHVNRAPIAGLVAATSYTSGRFLPAYDPEAGEANERCTVNIQGDSSRVPVVQIAGIAARRIVCRVAAGDKLEAGQRFGLIRFGSRTDCYLPRGSELRVAAGDRVRGGVTVLGMLR